MKKRAFAAALTAAILLGSLSACHTAKPAESEAPPPAPPFNAAAFEDQSLGYFADYPINGGAPITLSMWVNEDWLESYTFLLEEYKKYRPNVTVELTAFPWKTYWAKLRLAVQNGSGPDVFHMHNGFLTDFTPYISPLPEEMFGEAVLSRSFSGTASVPGDGTRYCVNLGSSTGGIFYNKKMWRQAGLTEEDIPRTWAQMRDMAIRLTQYDAEGNIVVDGFSFVGEAQSLVYAMQAQKGIPVFLEGGKSNLCTAENIENVYFLRKLCLEDKVCRVNEAPSNDLFGREKAAMIYSWSWVANDLEMNYPATEYGFFRPPTWTEETPPAYDYNNFETSFSINASSDQTKRRVAEDLLLFYLCNDEVLIKTARQAQIVPSKISLVATKSAQLGEVIAAQAAYIERTAFKGVVPDAVYTYLSPLTSIDMLDSSFGITDLLRAADEETTKILKAYHFQSALPQYLYYEEFEK